MKLLRLLWLPMLSIASMADSIIDSIYNWLTWPNFATLIVFAIMCLFFSKAVKANKKHHGQ
jgi:hypothetical protein